MEPVGADRPRRRNSCRISPSKCGHCWLTPTSSTNRQPDRPPPQPPGSVIENSMTITAHREGLRELIGSTGGENGTHTQAMAFKHMLMWIGQVRCPQYDARGIFLT